jgi:uncharacterized protein
MIATSVVLVLTGVSFVAGFVDSIAGGGGLLMIPTILLAGIPAHMALGTNKLASSLGTGVSVWNFCRQGKVMFKLAAVGMAFMIIGGVFGSQLALMLDSAILGKVLIWMLPFGMVATLIKKKTKTAVHELTRTDLLVKLPIIGLFMGVYDGFFGPGTGSFLILAFFLVMHLGFVQASAHAKVLNLGSNLGALLSFVLSGKVWFLLALPLGMANMAGNYVGSRLVIKRGDGVVRFVLVGVWVVLFVTLASRYLLS